jgi:hypothetical protein
VKPGAAITKSAAHRNVDTVPATATVVIDDEHRDGEDNHEKNDVG